MKDTLQPRLAAREPSSAGVTTASTLGTTSAPASSAATNIASSSSESASAVDQNSDELAEGAIESIAVGSTNVLIALAVGAIFL